MAEIDYKVYSAISATDIQIVMNGIVMGNVQNISISEQRQKTPIYTFGSTDPRQFIRGNRMIIGTLGGVVLVPNSFLDAVVKAISDFMSGKASGLTLYPRDKYLYTDRQDLVARYMNIAKKLNLQYTGEWHREETLDALGTSITYDRTVPVFLNELPPFDVLIQGQNEYGKKAVKWIYGCEITDEGIFIDMSGTTQILERVNFVARQASPWEAVED